ncbi:hypothetical protein SK128_020358, partial [Halocaridina rubra]
IEPPGNTEVPVSQVTANEQPARTPNNKFLHCQFKFFYSLTSDDVLSFLPIHRSLALLGATCCPYPLPQSIPAPLHPNKENLFLVRD